MPIALALVAGGFATLNPCGFATLLSKSCRTRN